MAIFQAKDIGRLDWILLRQGPITLYNQKQILAADLVWLREREYQIDEFDCAWWRTVDDMHTSLASQLGFPSYYGRNLDALNDAIGDLGVKESSGRVLVFNRYNSFVALFPKIAWHVLDIIATQSRIMQLRGLRLMVMVQSDDSHLTFDSVGACPVLWNPREWSQKSRRGQFTDPKQSDVLERCT